MAENDKEQLLTDFLEEKAPESLKKMVAYLESVISETEDVEFCCPNCKEKTVIQAAASHNTRIAAVRALKELLIDKVKGNKRDRTAEEKGFDFRKALEDVAKARQKKEKEAEKAGKLTKLLQKPAKKSKLQAFREKASK